MSGSPAVRVKICGIRETDAALAAAQSGADFIGVVFVPVRRRRLDEDKALRVISTLRNEVEAPPKVVGLFADQPLTEVHRTTRYCNLDMVQLCGVESLDYCDQVGVPVIKVVHVSSSLDVGDGVNRLSEEMTILDQHGHLTTLDRRVEGLQGGTGQSFNWDIAAGLSTKGFSFLLAGGLTPENVGPAVHSVRPWGVDVSSGVETDGVKDEKKIRAFINNVRGYKAL